jgi:5-methylcytosine-specific restriction endonuclease McrA
MLPRNRKEFKKQWPSFQAWLLERGSAIFEPTNSYEVARFLTDVGIGIVYANGRDQITNWINNADVAYRAFATSQAWRAVERVNRGKKTQQDYKALVARDGNGCLYCAAALSIDVAMIEHIIPITAGGTNHLANKALACRGCNDEAGHLSVRQKIELAIAKRAAP